VLKTQTINYRLKLWTSDVSKHKLIMVFQQLFMIFKLYCLI